MDSSSLIWGLLFGSIGLGYLVYGRRQRAIVPVIAGLSLIAAPYFVPNAVALVIVGIVLLALPFFVRI